MNKSKLKNISRRDKIKYKIRKKIKGSEERPRLVVYRSLNHIYTQLIDDVNNKTLLYVASNSKDVQGQFKDCKGKISRSKIVGKITAERALTMNIKTVVFDRSGYLYHGRVKAIAEGAKEAGLKF